MCVGGLAHTDVTEEKGEKKRRERRGKWGPSSGTVTVAFMEMVTSLSEELANGFVRLLLLLPSAAAAAATHKYT